jgi:prepilin-type N-terminal cleavage/methylation domain-containing protein
MRRAFTIVELVVALGISSALATVLYQLLWQGRLIGERVGAASTSGQEARLKARRMTNEIQEGTRLFYPRPGATAEGLGFVNARGETVIYLIDKGELKRVNLNTPREPPEVLVQNVKHFRATVAPCGLGRAPGRVNLDLAVGVDAGEANVATSVFLRSLEKYVPEDPTHEPLGIERRTP